MLLKDFPVFEPVDAARVEDLSAAGSTRDVAAGGDIIVMGSRGDSLFLLLEGTVDVLRVEGGVERKLATMEAPAIFGEMEFLTGAPRSATIRATTAAQLWALPIERLRRRLDDGDVAALQLVRGIAVVVAKRLAATVEKLHEIEKDSPAQRKDELRDFRQKLFFDWSF
jgi:CRP-like cAMP-binding protein